jgi:hypothetical protein
MRLIPTPWAAGLILSLNTEELMVLLQPGEMLRALIDGDADVRASAKFMLPDFAVAQPGGEVRMALPSPAAAALLTLPAGHATERRLQHLIFDALAPAE